jgi:hypothetical protein
MQKPAFDPETQAKIDKLNRMVAMSGTKTYTEPTAEQAAENRAFHRRQLRAAAAIANQGRIQAELFPFDPEAPFAPDPEAEKK